jgi:hypothetical protein
VVRTESRQQLELKPWPQKCGCSQLGALSPFPTGSWAPALGAPGRSRCMRCLGPGSLPSPEQQHCGFCATWTNRRRFMGIGMRLQENADECLHFATWRWVAAKRRKCTPGSIEMLTPRGASTPRTPQVPIDFQRGYVFKHFQWHGNACAPISKGSVLLKSMRLLPHAGD